MEWQQNIEHSHAELWHTSDLGVQPLLFTLLTYDSNARSSSNRVIMFADDTTVTDLISKNMESQYREEVENLVKWCENDNEFKSGQDKGSDCELRWSRPPFYHLSTGALSRASWLAASQCGTAAVKHQTGSQSLSLILPSTVLCNQKRRNTCPLQPQEVQHRERNQAVGLPEIGESNVDVVEISTTQSHSCSATLHVPVITRQQLSHVLIFSPHLGFICFCFPGLHSPIIHLLLFCNHTPPLPPPAHHLFPHFYPPITQWLMSTLLFSFSYWLCALSSLGPEILTISLPPQMLLNLINSFSR
ncbi:uncharacterized protein [Narcine bancroftii]|uniref:uncharacterized protein n=1 Tax=Narcine bancroftii TaxID=1343680 RepID=UPI003831C881